MAAIAEKGELAFHETPTVDGAPRKGKKSKRTFYSEQEMFTLLMELKARDISLLVIEKQQPMPNNRPTAAFGTGYGYGLWKMALVAAGIPFEEVVSASWKAKLGVRGQGDTTETRRKDSKRKSIEKARALFPGVDLLRNSRCRVPSDDKAEALLLAEVARRRYAGAM